MKKAFCPFLALLLTLALTLGASVPALAMTMYENPDDPVINGIESMDTVIWEATKNTPEIKLGDLFRTGSLGSAESSGWLGYYTAPDEMSWTLKDGVLIINASEGSATPYTLRYSPFWHNPYIETIVIDSRVKNAYWLFRNDLPNLKTVIFLGPTHFRFDGEYTNTNVVPGDFPEDQEISFVFENCYKSNELESYHYYATASYGYGPAVSTKIGYNDWGEGVKMFGKARGTQDNYSTFVPGEDRAGYVAAAAPILQNARLNKAAIEMLPEDLVLAVNAIGGFRNSADTPVIFPITPAPDASKVSAWAEEGTHKAFSYYIGWHGCTGDNGAFDYSVLDWKGRDLTVNISRGEFASLVIDAYIAITGQDRRSIGSNYRESDVTFVDMGYGNPHESDFYRAYNLGIMLGYSDIIRKDQPQFRNSGANDLLTREQAAAVLDRLATACGKSLPKGENPFTDGVSDWAAANVGSVYAAGIMNGVGGTSFDPRGYYTVEQAIVTLARMTDYTGVSVEPYNVEDGVQAAVKAKNEADAAASAERAAKVAEVEKERNRLIELSKFALDWFAAQNVPFIYAYYYDTDGNAVRICTYRDGRMESTVIGKETPKIIWDRAGGIQDGTTGKGLFDYWIDADGNYNLMDHCRS